MRLVNAAEIQNKVRQLRKLVAGGLSADAALGYIDAILDFTEEESISDSILDSGVRQFFTDSINEAMAAKDRSVSVYFFARGPQITFSPLLDDEKDNGDDNGAST